METAFSKSATVLRNTAHASDVTVDVTGPVTVEKRSRGEERRGEESIEEESTSPRAGAKGPSPEAVEIAEYLESAIHSHTPTVRTNPSGWARDIDLALRIDKRTPDQLRRVIDVAHRNDD